MAVFLFIAIVLNFVTADAIAYQAKSTSFYDDIPGNKYSLRGHLFDFNSKGMIDEILKLESDLDYFAGFHFGVRPFDSPEVYRSLVRSSYFGLNVNITGNFKVEVLSLMRFEVEIQLVPIVMVLDWAGYIGSFLEDNCFWIEGKFEPMVFKTFLT